MTAVEQSLVDRLDVAARNVAWALDLAERKSWCQVKPGPLADALQVFREVADELRSEVTS